MDIMITMLLRTSSSDINQVVDAIYKPVEKLVTSANLNKERKLKTNTILEFNAIEVKPGSMVNREFKFPDDLDKIQKQV